MAAAARKVSAAQGPLPCSKKLDFTLIFSHSVDQPVLPGFLRGDVRTVRTLHLLFNEDGESLRAGLPRPAEVPRYCH